MVLVTETTARRNLLDNLDAKYRAILGQWISFSPTSNPSGYKPLPRFLDVPNAKCQVILYLRSVMHAQVLISHKFSDSYVRRGGYAHHG